MAGGPEGLESAGGAATHSHTSRKRERERERSDVTHCWAPQGSAACTMSGRRNDLWIQREQSSNVHWVSLSPSTTWISDTKGSLLCLRVDLRLSFGISNEVGGVRTKKIKEYREGKNRHFTATFLVVLLRSNMSGSCLTQEKKKKAADIPTWI